MKHTLTIQKRLKELGYDPGPLDNRMGEQTKAAIKLYQASVGLDPDGIVGARTEASLWPPKAIVTSTVGGFDKSSAKSLANAHADLQRVLVLARKEVEFRVLDSLRGKAAQEKAYREKRSKARFGQSAHNYYPAIAVDLFPAPYDWNNLDAFKRLAKVVLRIAKEIGVPLRWGGDWNMDGDKTKTDAWDKPHFELNPWREYSKKATLYKGA